MRNILVPQTGQTPCVAGLPFFILMALGLLISLFVLHFIQYACISFLLSRFTKQNSRYEKEASMPSQEGVTPGGG
jgi:hypothetical protein